MNERCRRLLEATPEPVEARCELIGYAHVHEAAAAVRIPSVPCFRAGCF